MLCIVLIKRCLHCGGTCHHQQLSLGGMETVPLLQGNGEKRPNRKRIETLLNIPSAFTGGRLVFLGGLRTPFTSGQMRAKNLLILCLQRTKVK